MWFQNFLKKSVIVCLVVLFSDISLLSANPAQDAIRAGDLEEAYKLLYVEAIKGDAASQYQLAEMCMKGEGVTRDPVEGVRWYREASKQGVAESQEKLALALLSGNGVGQDNLEALKWAKAAARQGLPTSQYILATMYEDGKGVQKDYQEAYRWYEKSANNGYTKSMMRQADMLLYGKGIKKNVYLGLVLYEKAAKLGDFVAQQRFEELEDRKLCYFSASSSLFGQYLKCTTRKNFHNEIIVRGGKLLNRDARSGMVYDSKELLQGSYKFEVITNANDEIAQATYYFKKEMSMDKSNDQMHKIDLQHLKNMLETKYGNQLEKEGIPGVGSIVYSWQQKDGIEIELSQTSPGADIILSYKIPERLAKLELEKQQQQNSNFEKHMMPMMDAF